MADDRKESYFAWADRVTDEEAEATRLTEQVINAPHPPGGYVESGSLTSEELIAHHVGQILDSLGYDRNDPHFMRTPKRAALALLGFKRNGTDEEAARLLEVQFIEEGAVSSVVIEGPIRYNSMCAHHMLSVQGWAWVGYLPNNSVCGLSKLARIVHHYANQLTVQERVTQQIANAIEEHLKPLGTMVIVDAEHGCMKVRGIMEPCAATVTSAVRGVFRESPAARNEFLMLRKAPPR